MKLQLLSLGLLTILCYSNNSFASGYEVPFGAISQLGSAMSGEAAAAQDASTGYFNPAGLTRITQKQLVISTTGAMLTSKFMGNATSPTAIPNASSYDWNQTGNATLVAGGIVPAIHYAVPVFNNRTVLGFSLVAPYGLGGDFAKDSIVRYTLQSAALSTLDLSPSIGYRATDRLAIGVGFDIVYASQTSLNAVRFAPFPDGSLETDAGGWGYGWHGGVLYQLSKATRLGVTYRSQLTADLRGFSKFTMPSFTGGSPTIYENHQLSTATTLPPATAIGIYHNLNSRWDVMGTVKYTQWARLPDSILYNVITPAGLTNGEAPIKYKNAFECNLGAHYKLNTTWQFSTGAGYAQTPTNDISRSIGFMDVGRYILSVGTHYQATRDTGVDFGYAHYLTKQVPVNHPGINREIGVGKNNIDLIGLQLTWNFS